MARARNIKPGFFRNADLVELPFEARLLFIGLWTLADREGRLDDRPKQIKMEIFPADSVDVDDLLTALHDSDFIERYEVNNIKYIQILKFSKHQNPHRDEKASSIPAPCLHSANTVAIGLIPDSLIPEEKALVNDDAVDLPAKKDCPHESIIALYHETLPALPRVVVWDERRKTYLRSRWREDPERQSLDWWRRWFGYVGKSDFLMGRVESKDRKPFQANLEWMLKPSNFVKILEGNYES